MTYIPPNPYTTSQSSFYVVMVNVNPGLTIIDVQNALITVPWHRIANNVWVIHTPLGKDHLYNHLFHLAYPSGTLFISRLDISEHQGLLPKPFWDWLNTQKALAALGY